jgi:hypothetical protein
MKDRKTNRVYGKRKHEVLSLAARKPTIDRLDFPSLTAKHSVAILNQMVKYGYLRVVQRGSIGRPSEDSIRTQYALDTRAA